MFPSAGCLGQVELWLIRASFKYIELLESVLDHLLFYDRIKLDLTMQYVHLPSNSNVIVYNTYVRVFGQFQSIINQFYLTDSKVSLDIHVYYYYFFFENKPIIN